MLNKKMYLKLQKVYNSQTEPRTPKKLCEVERIAMVLAGRTRLTKGEIPGLQKCLKY